MDCREPRSGATGKRNVLMALARVLLRPWMPSQGHAARVRSDCPWHPFVTAAYLLLAFCLHPAFAQDWPTYMHDAGRTGVTAGRIELPLAEHWVYHAPAEPRPAWPLPQHGWTELPKTTFDDAL